MLLLKPVKLLLFLVVLLLAAIVVGGFFADDLAKAGIETGASTALGVPTSVSSCNVGFFSGTFSLDGLDVANPEGYAGGSFLELGRGSVEVSALSLLSDKIEVPELTLSTVRVRLVQGMRGSNYGTILDNLKRFQGSSEPDTSEGKRFVIGKLTLADVVVTVLPVPELGLPEAKLPIGTIELKDVGSESDQGVLLSELAGILVEAILQRASVSGQLPGIIQGALDGQLGALKGMADQGVKAIEGLLPTDKLPAGAKDRVDDAKKALEKGIGGGLKKGLGGLGLGGR